MLAASTTWWLLLTLPAWGMGLVLLAALRLRGPARRMLLVFGPVLVGVAMWWVEPFVYDPRDQWLPQLFTLAVRGLSWLVLLGWFAGYLVAAIGGWLRHNAERRAAGTAASGDSMS